MPAVGKSSLPGRGGRGKSPGSTRLESGPRTGGAAMDRRSWIAELAAVVTAWMLWPRRLLVAADAKEPTLEDRLKSGLKCRRQDEFDFVSIVSQRVRTGKIPEALVLQTMQWSLKKNPKFPFFYFQFAVKKQANALGVSL